MKCLAGSYRSPITMSLHDDTGQNDKDVAKVNKHKKYYETYVI